MGTKKTKKAPEQVPAANQPPTVMMIRLGRIYVSKFNPRLIRPNDPAIAELAESLKARGMLHPVVVRENPLDGQPNCDYELLAGCRRFNAAEYAGMTEIPCSVVQADDETAIEICVTENLQRESLNPIEEANGVARLLGLGMSHAQAAGKIGKSERWVWRRVSLQNLIPRIKVEVERGTRGLPEEIEDYEVPAWLCAPAAALEVVARLPYGIQDDVYDKYTIGMTIDDLRETCAARMRDLASAEWARDARSAQSKACAKCTKRTDAQTMLFDDMADKGARCLDGECWQRQSAAWKVAHPPPMTTAGTSLRGATDDNDLDGDGDGDDAKPQKVSGPTRQQKIDFAYVDTIRCQVNAFKAEHMDREVLCALAAVFGVGTSQTVIQRTDKEWAMFDAALNDLKEGTGSRAKTVLWAGAKAVLMLRIGCENAYAMAANDRRIGEATRIGKMLDLDVEAICSEVEFDEKTEE
jgi:ParB/RepB/Spo0J family partition protein